MNFLLYSNGKKVTDQILLSQWRDDEIGIFESLRTYKGKIFQLEEHLDRLFESAKTSGFSSQERSQKKGQSPKGTVPTRKQLRKELELGLQAFKREEPGIKEDLFLRLTLGRAGIFLLIGKRVHAPELYRRGVALKTSPVKRSLSNASFPEVKTSSYQNAVLASLEPAGAGTYEWLFLDRNGFVTEVRIGNIFIVKNGGAGLVPGRKGRPQGSPLLVTPPTIGILNGVTRRFVIKCALALQLEVKEVPLTRHEIYNADEAFLTNTSWEILPVRELDSRQIGTRIPGPVTLKLMRKFKTQI